MISNRIAAGAFAAAALMATPAHAQGADTLSALRRDMETMRKDYEAKVSDLESRLAKAEADASAAKAAVDAGAAAAAPADPGLALLAPAPDQSYAQAGPAPATSGNAFNPGIAAVLNGFAVAATRDLSSDIPGFATSEEAGGPARGLSLGESEVSFAANIDPFLAGFLGLSIDGEDQLGLEEAYIRTTALPGGVTLKAGRFFSGIGYLNERHAHDWSFSDAPLPYRAFLGPQFGDDGVQVRWLAPVDTFLELGGEVFRGEGYPASGAANNGVGAYTAFLHTGADLGVSSSWLGALSYLHTKAVDRETGAGDLFTGDTDTGIASLVYKWAPNGNPISRNLTLASEVFWGREKGAFNAVDFNQDRFGWYAQGVYQFRPQWSAGLRVAGVNAKLPGAGLAGSTLDDLGRTPFATTLLLERDTSEFGRLRVQYTNDQTADKTNNQLMLQYTVIYGPHGAHRY
jgi:hypothetical protein